METEFRVKMLTFVSFNKKRIAINKSILFQTNTVTSRA